MDTGYDLYFIGALLEIVFIDLLLSGDNAVVIALACRRLSPKAMRMGIFLGAGAAIVLRVIFTALATFVLEIPYLKLVGATALIFIAIKLLTPHEDDEADVAASDNLWAAVRIIAVADAVMSLDNVLAVAAAADGSVFLLVFGLLVSMPLLVYGSTVVGHLLKRHPILVSAGGALLGWIAGNIGVSDPAIAAWVDAEAPAFIVVAPFLGAVTVLAASAIVKQRRAMNKAEGEAAVALVEVSLDSGLAAPAVLPQPVES